MRRIKERKRERKRGEGGRVGWYEFVSEQFSVFHRAKGLAGRNNVYPRFGLAYSRGGGEEKWRNGGWDDGDTFFGCNFLSAPATERFDQSLNPF